MDGPRALPPGATPPRDGDRLGPRDVAGTLWRNRWLIAATWASVVALTLLVTLLMRPVYESEALLRIQPERESPSQLLGNMLPLGGFGLSGLGEDEIDTEIGVLESRQVADSVAAALALHVSLDRPRTPRDSVMRVVRAPTDASEGRYVLRHAGNGTYEVSARRHRSPRPLPGRVSLGESFRLGDVVLELSPALATDPPGTIRVSVRPFRRTVEQVQRRLDVSRHDARSRLVEVAFRDPDPLLAAAVVNGVTDRYMRYKEATSQWETRSRAEVLRDQSRSYEADLFDVEERLRSFREQARIIAPEEQASQQVRLMANAQAERDLLQVEREALAALLARIEEPGRTDPAVYRELATFPTFLAAGAIEEVLASLNELENERAALTVRYTAGHPDVHAINERIADIERQLLRMGRDYLRGVDSKMAAADGILARYDTELGTIPAREVEFFRLVREQKILDEVYLYLQTQLKEAEIKEAVDPGEVRLVDAGLVPYRPVSPRPLVNLLLATVLGFMVAVAGVVGREMMDTRVHSREDAERVSGGVPVLGSIPRMPLPDGRGAALGNGGPALLTAGAGSRDSAAEAFRSLRTNLTYADAQPPPRSIVITSPMPGDGKATSAANLALSLAQQGGRVLLVDADLRRGPLHPLMGGDRDPGLGDLLAGDAQEAAAVRTIRTGDEGIPLGFLPAGRCPRNPADLLGSERMRELLAGWRERFDTVVLNAPPLRLVTDAAVLATLVESTLVVVRAGTTERGPLHDAVQQLRKVRAARIGVVLNDVA